MPTLTITIPMRSLRKIKERALREGFKNPVDWARILVEKNIEIENSPKIRSGKIVAEMRQTGLYTARFLQELKRSLEYADKTAE